MAARTATKAAPAKAPAKKAAPKAATKAVAVVEEPEEVEAEIVEETMTKREATALNKKIQSMSEKVSDNMFELLSLLEQAATGSIHTALGYKSWTEWYSENVNIDVTDKDDRKMLVSVMTGKGMSQRAIAASLGIGQATVSRDLEGDSNGSGDITGLDGKTYKGKGGDDEDEEDEEPLDVDEVEDEPVSTRRVALPKLFTAAATVVVDAVSELSELTEDDRFIKSRKALATKLGDDIIAATELLHDALDKLGVEYPYPEETEEEDEAEDEETEEDSEDEETEEEDDEDEPF